MLNVMVTGLLRISMLLVASSCNLCLFTVKFYWNIKKKKKKLILVHHPLIHVLPSLCFLQMPILLFGRPGMMPTK